MEINSLKVLQPSLRDYEILKSMIDFVQSGGVYTKKRLREYNGYDANLIQITIFEDNQAYIHDGHHRIGSIWLANSRTYLLPEEYEITRFNYSNYTKPNFDKKWYTPFDPRTEVRLADFFDFREKIRIMSLEDPEIARKYIFDNKDEYVLPRRWNHISEIL